MSVASEAPAELARRLGGRPRAASWPPALSPVVAQVVERTRELGRFEMKAFLAAFPHVARSEYAQLRDYNCARGWLANECDAQEDGSGSAGSSDESGGGSSSAGQAGESSGCGCNTDEPRAIALAPLAVAMLAIRRRRRR